MNDEYRRSIAEFLESNSARRGMWRMELTQGFYWHACKDVIPAKDAKSVTELPDTPYCTKCLSVLPKEDEDFFKATWHILNLREKRKSPTRYGNGVA